MGDFLTFISILLFFAILYGIWKAIRGLIGKRGETGTGNMVCHDCGSQCDPAVKTRGSLLIEIIAWLLFLIPGIIYSLWRVSSRVNICPACGSERIVPINTPIGKKIMETHHAAPLPPQSAPPKSTQNTQPKPTQTPKTRLAEDQTINLKGE